MRYLDNYIKKHKVRNMNNKWILGALLATPAALVSTTATAGDSLVYWSNFQVSALYGTNFEVDLEDQATITLETAGGWKYGDWFAFHDFVSFTDAPDGAATHSDYGEYTTRVSMGKVFGADMNAGIFKDVSLAFQYEHGTGAASTVLYGIGTDWNIPGFSYLSANVYRRSELVAGPNPWNVRGDTNGYQLTTPFRIDFGNSGIVLDGYMDWIFDYDHGYKEPMVHINPQLKYNVGGSGFHVGVEYSYWANKYGIKDVDQNAYSLLLQYSF